MRHHDMQLLTGPCVDLFVIPDTDEACDLLANEEPPPYHEALSEAEGSVHAWSLKKTKSFLSSF